MGVTFFVCAPSAQADLEKLIDEMEEEDPLEEIENSAYDRFLARLETDHLGSIPLDDDASAPAQAFYEWFHGQINHDLDKLYLTPPECKRALEAIAKKAEKKGLDKLVTGFWTPADEYDPATAKAYLASVQQAMAQALELGGLFVIGYR
jgi:hypothetical protein